MKIAIVGATGAVGRDLYSILLSRTIFKNSIINLFASKRSEGTMINNNIVKEFQPEKINNIDYTFFCTSSTFSKKWAPLLSHKTTIIDNTSAFRMDNNIPLIVPEVNGDIIGNSKIIANPNCTTAIAMMVLYPIYKKYGLKKIINSTYQAVSGAGTEGIAELLGQATISGSEIKSKVFEHPIAYNVIPMIGDFYNNGYTTEENKFINETHKILDDDSIAISCTAVRVPTIRTHCESITIETVEELDSIEYIKDYLKYQPMISFNNLPMPDNASNIDDVLYGRIRKNNLFGNQGLDMFIAGDQIRRGAALNAVLIAEKIINSK
jgi:aspartate-semialdehyde dehydrogenase